MTVHPASKAVPASLSAAALALAAAGCNPLPPPATATSVSAIVSTQTPPPFSAHAFLNAVGPDSVRYPIRYFSPDGDFSLQVPGEWEFNQQADSGQELDSVSEIQGGMPFVAFYSLKKIGNGKSAQDALEAFLLRDWVADRQVEIIEQSEYVNIAGLSGWRASGTVLVDPAHGEREKFSVIAFVASNTGYFMTIYPDRSAAPIPLLKKIHSMIDTLRWEESQTREIDTTNALQLAQPDSVILDPAMTVEGAAGPVGDIFSGLVALDTSLNIQPGLAERWDVSLDGRTYTFHLRPQAKFHNGRPVTADDVLFSWLRAASPELASGTALRFLGDIAGMRDYREGKTDYVSGLQVVDSLTLRATLDAPKTYFLEKLTSPAAWIVDRYNVRLPNWKFNPNGTGPFRVTQHVLEKSILMEPSENFFGSPARLKFLMYWLTSAKDDVLYKSGKVDQMVVPEAVLPRANDPHNPLFGNISIEHTLCTNFIQFNASLPPFDDPLVRKAFAVSINRDIYVEVTPENGDLPGSDILPPGMTGYESGSARAPYDPKEAKALLRRSRYFDGSQTAPEIRFILPSEAGEYDSTMEYLVTSWEKNLGVNVFVEGVARDAFGERTRDDPPGQFIFGNLCADYPDPENFYTYLFHGAFAGIHFGYQNPALDSILDSASVEPDWFVRMDLYRQADRIIFDDAPMIILSYRGPAYVVWKPRVMGFVPTRIDVPQHHLLWIRSD